MAKSIDMAVDVLDNIIGVFKEEDDQSRDVVAVGMATHAHAGIAVKAMGGSCQWDRGGCRYRGSKRAAARWGQPWRMVKRQLRELYIK